MPTKTHSIELPTELPTPPEHFRIEVVSVEQGDSINFNHDFPVKKYPNPLAYAVTDYLEILDAFTLQANATDGVSSIYARWDKGNLQWSGWYDANDDEPADFPELAYYRDVDARAKAIYEKYEGNREWSDCYEQAETEISGEINAEAQNV